MLFNCKICNNIILKNPVFCQECKTKFCYECIKNFVFKNGSKCFFCKNSPLLITEIKENYECKFCLTNFFEDKNLLLKHLYEKHLELIIAENSKKK